MAEGNGVDLGTVVAMLAGVLEGQDALRVDISSVRLEMQQGFRAVNGRVDNLAQEVRDLRETVNLVHGAVIGHGIMLTDHEDRIGRLEADHPRET